MFFLIKTVHLFNTIYLNNYGSLIINVSYYFFLRLTEDAEFDLVELESKNKI